MKQSAVGSGQLAGEGASCRLPTAHCRPIFPLAFLAAVGLMLFALPLIRGEVFTIRDHFDYFQPLRWFTAAELREGRLPLWNPYSAAGEPWLANPQTGVFYPPTWLFLVLPFPTAYMLYLLGHLVLLGWGAYLLFTRTVSRGAAMVGAVALIISGPILSLLDVQNNLATLAWIPLALWCATEGAWRRGGIVLAMAFLGGEPFFAAVGALLYVVASYGLRRARGTGGGDWQRSTRNVTLAALIAFGLAAIQLFPFLEIVQRSDRAAGLDAAMVLHDSMPLRDWVRVAVPPNLDASAMDPSMGQHFIPMIYVGIIVTALALIGIVDTGWRRRDSSGVSPANRQPATANLAWLALLVFSVLLSLGPEFLARLPLTLFRYPARLVPLAAMAIAALAAAGWDRVRPNRRWLDLVIVLLVIVDVVPRAWPLLRTAPFRTDVVPYPKKIGAVSKILRVGAIDPSRRAAWISGYLNLYDRRFDTGTPAPLTTEAYLRFHKRLLKVPTREQLAQTAAGFVVTTHDLSSSLDVAARADGVTVYRNFAKFPMASLMVREPLTMILVAGWSVDTSHAHVTVEAPQEGVVTLLQQAAPGWRVTVDGTPAKSVLIYGVFRGVQITRGRHEIVWTYRPQSLVIGSIITLMTLLTVGLSGFVKRAR